MISAVKQHKHLSKRSKAVGCAASIGDNVILYFSLTTATNMGASLLEAEMTTFAAPPYKTLRKTIRCFQ